MKYAVGDEIVFDDEKYQITQISVRAKDNGKKVVLQEIIESNDES